MSTARKSSRQRDGKPQPTNWLARLDKTARKLRPTGSWLQPYDYFVLTRYPHLQPQDPALRDLPDGYVRGGRQTYLQQLDRQEALLSKEVPLALERLSPTQRREVAALVFTLTVDLEERGKWKTAPKEIDKHRRQVLRLERSLQTNSRKMEKIIEERLAEFRVDPRVVGHSRELISRAMAQLMPIVPAIYYSALIDALKQSPVFQKAGKDIPALAMAQLYWLFHYGCRLSVGESEVRVALIRNKLWSRYAKRVNYVIGSAEESRGCDAVRKAVERFVS